MKLGDFKLLTDENIEPEVVAFLRHSGFDVWDVRENNSHGATDVELMRRAFADDRVIVTHDPDFGTLAILSGEPVIGIAFLRPGHIDAQYTIDSIRSILATGPDLIPPFLLVAKRSGGNVTIRVRQLGP